MKASSELPSTRYAKSGSVHVAYQVFGAGQIDLVFVPGFVSNIDPGIAIDCGTVTIPTLDGGA
jgi:hypothetical protein